MLSGNGRHRRPRQAPALIVAAGVTGSAIAIPLLGASSASAADASTWDRVAECESGGAWSADFGNGFYGGLQFSEETWVAYGGTAYAPSADLASRSQQIAVAEKVLAAEGPQAWPACGPLAGLVDDGTDTGVDPGILPVPQQSEAPAAGPSEDVSGEDGPTDATDGGTPDDSSEGPGRTGAQGRTGTSQPSRDVSDAPDSTDEAATAPDASDGAAGAAPSGDATSGGGKHRGSPADDEAETGTTEEDRESGRHASRSDTSGRNAVDEATGPGVYTVQPGDNLCEIAAKKDVPGGWPALYEANEKAVGADPDLIMPGQSLDLSLNRS